MFYHTHQPCTPSFPIGLVKTKSDFIVRSVETGLGRWTLVLAVISVDAYRFLAFSDLTCHLEDTGKGRCVLVVLWRLIIKRPKLEVATKRLLHQQVKYRGSFSAMFAYGSASLQLFPVMWIFRRSQGVICYDRWDLREGHKNYFKDWFLMNSQPTFLFITCYNSMNYGHIIKRM